MRKYITSTIYLERALSEEEEVMRGGNGRSTIIFFMFAILELSFATT